MRTMSSRPSRNILWTALVPSAFTLLFPTGCPRTATTGPAKTNNGGNTDSQDQAFDALTKATDLPTVRGAVQQLDLNLRNNPELQADPLTQERRQMFEDKQLFGLDDGEFKEIEHPHFTGVDPQHLELAFLMRDAVRAAELNDGTPAEQAAAS